MSNRFILCSVIEAHMNAVQEINGVMRSDLDPNLFKLPLLFHSPTAVNIPSRLSANSCPRAPRAPPMVSDIHVVRFPVHEIHFNLPGPLIDIIWWKGPDIIINLDSF